MANTGGVHITLEYDRNNNIFNFFQGEHWRQIKVKAVNRGAYALKKEVKKKFEQKMPAASKPITSKAPNGTKWRGKLIDVVRQGIADSNFGRTYTNVHILGTRKSGQGDFIGLFYNKGNFKNPGRWGKKGGKEDSGWGKRHHFRGDLQALNYLPEGSRGFRFDDTVEEILKAHIENINRKRK